MIILTVAMGGFGTFYNGNGPHIVRCGHDCYNVLRIRNVDYIIGHSKPFQIMCHTRQKWVILSVCIIVLL